MLAAIFKQRASEVLSAYIEYEYGQDLKVFGLLAKYVQIKLGACPDPDPKPTYVPRLIN